MTACLQVRAAVVEMLEGWVSVAPAEPLFAELCDIIASPKCVGEGMQAAIEWMAKAAEAGKVVGGDCLAYAVKAVALGAEYKTAPVREAAAHLVTALLAAGAPQEVAAAANGLEKGLQKVAMEAINKAAGGIVSAAPSGGASSRPGTAGAMGEAPFWVLVAALGKSAQDTYMRPCHPWCVVTCVWIYIT